MRIILENEYYTVTIKDKQGDIDIHALMELFKHGSLALGYQPESVNNGFVGMAEEVTEAKEVSDGR
jgi:hypothetical protein